LHKRFPENTLARRRSDRRTSGFSSYSINICFAKAELFLHKILLSDIAQNREDAPCTL